MNLALFDFDGTVTRTDTWTPFMRLAVRPARMLAARALLGPVVVGYRLGMVSASQGRQMAARVGFRGESAAGVRQLGVEYATAALPGTVRKPAIERIAWHQSRGDHVVIVSASLDVYLGPWCERRGLDCICTGLEEQDGKFTGRYIEGDCTGREKVRRVRDRYDLARYEVVYGYGDSGEDREMLELAHRRFYRGQEILSRDHVTSFGHPGG